MIAKRFFDLFFVIPGLLVLAPFFVVIALLIKLDSKGPVFFRQTRVGKNGVPFSIFKFRTMVVNAEKQGTSITVGQDRRITRLGYILRNYKIDELPQLLNVLLGQMSLVGPRPEVPEYVNYYPDDVRSVVLSVPPGITDMASIEFRNESDVLGKSNDPVTTYINEILPVKLGYYVNYVENRSISMDLRLIIKTIMMIIR